MYASLGVQTDYIEYMIGHTISTCHGIQMKGIEYLCGIYFASALRIKPKTRVSINALKEIIRACGLNQTKFSPKQLSDFPENLFLMNCYVPVDC